MRSARADARQLRCSHGFADQHCDDAVFVLSELLGTAVRHGAPPVSYDIEINGDEVLVTVADADRGAPATTVDVSATAESGRGLLSVQDFARRSGADLTQHGKRVWALV